MIDGMGLNRLMNITKGIHKDEKLRDGQIQAIDFINNSDKQFIAINGPTGIGKSIIGFEATPPPFWYCCSSINLEHQLEHDFPEAKLLKGRSNYFCEYFGTADLCMLSGSDKCLDCAYEQAKRAAMKCNYSILNFHYFLTAANYTNFTENMRNVIIDEADNLEGVLLNFISFEFRLKTLQALKLAQSFPEKKTKLEAFIKWLEPMKGWLKYEILTLKPIIDELKEFKHSLDITEQKMVRKYNKLLSIKTKVDFLNSQDLNDETWVYYHNNNLISLKPKWLNRGLTNMFLFNHGKRFLFMSATLPSKPVFCGLYDLESKEVDYLELDSPFDLERRLVYYLGKYSLSKKEMK